MRRSFLVSLLFVCAALRAQDYKPLPLDPLTDSERARAETIARADSRVRPFLAGRTQLIYVEFLAVKRDESREEPTRRHADVLFYGYESNSGLRVLVDLAANSVVDTAKVAGTSVPISQAEIEEAVQIALGSSAVRRLAGSRLSTFRGATNDRSIQNRIEGLRTLGAGPTDPCTTGRCVELFFRTGERGRNRYLFLHQVIVNLTTRETAVLPSAAPPQHHD